ncbi:MAG TPA: undecaprenyl-diphosphatase UppP [Chloroflexota bacterium]|nr:undecaprenyl-diphosphatase UppP [Chloroflexota bacterium]
MDPFEGAVLGIVQGLTEPLPISSSAHLVLVPWLLGWPEHSLTFDVALHMGTLAALLIFFWRDLLLLVRAWLPERGAPLGVVGTARTSATADDPVRRQQRRLGLGLLVGSIPAALLGALFADQIESSLRSPLSIAALLIVGALLLGLADRIGARRLELTDVGLTQALLVGLAQALALAPGVSRSGITLTAALFIGLTREAGARYAFLLGIPVTAGAGVFQLRRLLRDGIPVEERAAFALGVFCSLVVGLLAIRFLLRYVRQHSLNLFVYYRLALGLIVLLVAALRGAAG